ncbi:MAG TPA: VOC family protein [Caulifigura sp.]|jgi:predicted enzyme related to lactoylglutathione lyase|nr:VOC family protein [Caulifigura sp.]
MSQMNSKINRVVWCDVPVADLDRATAFYSAVLKIKIHRETFGEFTFAVLDHADGNGGCLVPKPEEISATGPLVYFNVTGRIAEAAAEVAKHGGKVLAPPHSIGPHGSRAVVLDSEGNRVAIHSEEQVGGG